MKIKIHYFFYTNCKNHLCGRIDMFSELDEAFNLEVKFWIDTKVPIKGRGKLSIKLNNGFQNCISSVFDVPSLHQNL